MAEDNPGGASVVVLLQKLGRREESKAEFQKAKNLMDAAVSKDRDEWGEKMVPSPELQQPN